jgi:hypothetical protein
MSAFPIALIVSMLISGCGKCEKPTPLSPDELMRGKMIGTWGDKHGTMKLFADGSFKEAWANRSHVPPASWIYEGDWSVSKGEVIVTITKAVPINTTNIEPVGSIDIVRIVRVDQTNLALASDDQTNVLTRKDR